MTAAKQYAASHSILSAAERLRLQLAHEAGQRATWDRVREAVQRIPGEVDSVLSTRQPDTYQFSDEAWRRLKAAHAKEQTS